ncbi:MAG TPA: hypothetical protein VMJ93_16115 [Verrucomicrobiae bacterium]|nr:hypothetical protein [Verrucomicrobiae bacterium]
MATTVLSKPAANPVRSDSPAAPDLRHASDDEILNLSPRAIPKKKFGRDVESGSERPAAEPNAGAGTDAPSGATAVEPGGAAALDANPPLPENLQAALDEHPELRSAWDDASAYRESFASPDEARQATRMLGDLNRLDALFFSSRPEDHAELARTIAQLDSGAAASLARALGRLAAEPQNHGEKNRSNAAGLSAGEAPGSPAEVPGSSDPASPGRTARNAQASLDEPGAQTLEPRHSLSAAQTEFFHATNTAAVESVLDAIHSQVDRLLPEGTSQGARNRVVGEVYRELDASLRANRQLNEQVRQAFRTGALDAAHQHAIVSLITSRARQALPGVAKRVLSEWTAALVSAGAERRTRQRAAETRVDIAGSGRSGSEGRRTLTPREIDYARLSDADILNL